jgi:hypothetical protein
MRGASKQEPVNQISELRLEHMAKFLRIPATQFKREVDAGEWNGTFKYRGNIKWFVVHLVMEKQKEQAMKPLTIRRIAA